MDPERDGIWREQLACRIDNGNQKQKKKRESPRLLKKRKLIHDSSEDDEHADDTTVGIDDDAYPRAASGDDFLADEKERWKHMAREVYKVYEDEDGLLNEFRMMFELRKQFPLHYIIFKQCAVHLPHEANVESIFSLAGRVADPNMDSRTLQLLVRVNFNKKNYMPSVKEIRERYFRKYRKSGDLLDEKADNSSDPGEHATLQVEDE